MKEIDYAVIIRTTGNAGAKYRALLESIKQLEPAPREVIVVLPEGNDEPADRLGTETFYYCPRGMVRQRLYGIQKCSSRYALITDDDITFKADFVQKLYEPISRGECGLTAGPLPGFFPKGKKEKLVSFLMGAAVPDPFHRDIYNKVLRTTGYTYNTDIRAGSEKKYRTQSAPWTCFFADMEQLRSIHFEDEQWLDRYGYSAHDDTCMFYKACLCGVKTLVVGGAEYEHLDGGTSKRGNRENVEQSRGFNRIIFWHRFIYSQEKTAAGKGWSCFCISYRTIWQYLYNDIDVLRKRMSPEEAKCYKKGVSLGLNWIRSREYKDLRPIRY